MTSKGPDHKVNNLFQYINVLDDEKLLDNTQIINYRGVDCRAFMIPKLVRAWHGSIRHANCGEGDEEKHRSLSDFEKEILETFKRQAHLYLDRLPSCDLEWLSVGQHHGLPTRLLDWTKNPLVALYFSLCEKPRVDLHKDDEKDFCSVYAWKLKGDRYRLPENELKTVGYEIDTIKDASGKDVKRFVLQGYRTVRSSEPGKLDALEPIHPEREIYRFIPALVSPRMAAQQGVFSFEKLLTDRNFSEVLNPSFETTVVMGIDRKARNPLLMQLNRAGINRAQLFPTIEGLCKNIEWAMKKMNVT